MTLPIRPPYLPMEALSVADIPEGPDWQYEPKWDGFRCLVFRDGVGGFRYASSGKLVGSLLLGLYDEESLLHHVGFCSGLTTEHKKELTPRLEKLIKKPGFTGQTPGGSSRWSTERSAQWQPLAPKLVVEVQYDHCTGRRFRHGTRFLRWRPDKAPRQCTMDQLEGEKASPLILLKNT